MNKTLKILGFERRPFYSNSVLSEPLNSIEVTSIFLFGYCNFGCSYCKRGGQFKGKNGSIINSYRAKIEDVYNFIDQESRDPHKMFRISGGEPIVMNTQLFKEIMEYTKIKGMLRSIATNMSLPDRLAEILIEKDIEYLAGDFKAPPRYWEYVTGMPIKWIDRVMQSWRTWSEFRDKIPVECRIMIFPFTTLDDVKWIINHLYTKPIIVLRGYSEIEGLNEQSTSPNYVFSIAKKINLEYGFPTFVRIKWKTGSYFVENEEIKEV